MKKKVIRQLIKTNYSAISLNALFLYETKSTIYAVHRHILILHTGTPHMFCVVWTRLPASLPISLLSAGRQSYYVLLKDAT